MRKMDPAGDILTHHSVNAICSEIEKLDSKSQKQDDIPGLMQEILILVLRKHISITVKYAKRKFPQLYTEDNCLYIRYYIENFNHNEAKQSNILLQLSIAAVLACCPDSFVDDCIALDETFCSFSENWPIYANYANKIHNLISSKIIPE